MILILFRLQRYKKSCFPLIEKQKKCMENLTMQLFDYYVVTAKNDEQNDRGLLLRLFVKTHRPGQRSSQCSTIGTWDVCGGI